MTKYILPPGTYYIGDPCYVIEKNWDRLCEITDIQAGQYEMDGNKFVFMPTMHGDGVYEDRQGRQYGVDAGVLAVVPVGLLERTTEKKGERPLETLSYIASFTEDLVVSISKQKTLTICSGTEKIAIETKLF